MKKNLALLFLLIVLAGCNENDQQSQDGKYLVHPDWAEDVRIAVDSYIETNKNTGTYAVFDFDNSCCIFDIEEQLLAYQIENMCFAMDPSQFRSTISAGLENTPAANSIEDVCNAYSFLYDNYGPFTSEGVDNPETLQEDPMWLEFAAKTGVLYDSVCNWKGTVFGYEWVLYLFTGMTEEETYNLSYKSYTIHSAEETSQVTWESPSEIESLTGVKEYTFINGVSVPDNIRELFYALNHNGIDVWICSASAIRQVMGTIDKAGLHQNCRGVLGMTLKTDLEGKYIPEYDYQKGRGFIATDTGWKEHLLATHSITGGEGKVTSIENSIMPLYGNRGPSLGLMDSTGDFYFCTEFSSMQAVICMNRANRKITDGGGLIAEIAIYERDYLGYTFKNRGTDTFYLLQGRNENGLRSFNPSNATYRYGSSEEKLFANEDNYLQLQEMVSENLTVKEAIDRYSTLFTEDYNGYHSR